MKFTDSLNFPGGLDSKESAFIAGDLGLVFGSGRSGEENSNPLQYPCLENSTAEEPGRLPSLESQRVRLNQVTNILTFTNSLVLHMKGSRFELKSRISNHF